VWDRQSIPLNALGILDTERTAYAHSNRYLRAIEKNVRVNGWFHNLTECDLLIYHFLDGPAYVLQFGQLRKFDLSVRREASVKVCAGERHLGTLRPQCRP
jgi:hypothetical protein